MSAAEISDKPRQSLSGTCMSWSYDENLYVFHMFEKKGCETGPKGTELVRLSPSKMID